MKRLSGPTCLILAACAASTERPEPAASGTPTVSIQERRRIDQSFLPALDALEQAVLDDEDELARLILERLLARQPTGPALELALGFERILDGRALARDLSLELVALERLDRPGEYSLLLAASHPRRAEVVFRPGAGMLRESVVAVDAEGTEHRGGWTSAVTAVDELVVPAGEVVLLPLVDLKPPPTFSALAVRQRVALELLGGELLFEGRRLPARERSVGPVEIVRLASFLPTATVEPGELARYALEERIYLPALMERAVRVDPARRAEALDLIAPRATELSLLRIGELVPALRWLAPTTGPGGDPEAWRAWLDARAQFTSVQAGPRSAGLDMPRPVRVAGEQDEP